ncbi:FecR family protein [Sphingobacterium faecale]|uniref:FecR domain-containing protein n=1 Tax=Sphingobacterium faecale TaxID=2803775 RepID=A0ABS1QYM8_9SPHI|nr:FecR family protein [Sphingobacterium faecale]MBL1407532.1 FecR domain-containing protein [Sphingobacterium faecale]
MERNAKEILEKYKQGICTEEERTLVENYFNSTVQTNGEWPKVTQMQLSFEKGKTIPSTYQTASIMSRLWKRYRIVAAACFLLLACGLSYTYLFQNDEMTEVQSVNNDALPGGNKAILVLADGRRVNVDDIGTAPLTLEGGVTVYRSEAGEISYKSTTVARRESVNYNQIITPNGGMYSVVLSDGTKVKLNAGTSLRYPNRFMGDQRVVELTGEAYFDVKSNPSKPFIVKSSEQEIQVVGTRFNIQAYAGQAKARTTLVEGKINLKNLSSGMVRPLAPGEQGEVYGQRLVVEPTDLTVAMAWLNNTFVFKGTPIREIMLELSRWYDVEVDLENLPDETFYATLPRTVRLSKVLSALEETSNLKFTIQGRRVKVQ